MDLSDRELIMRYLSQRDEAAFGAIVDRYVDLVHSVARRTTGDGEMARDVAQKTFIQLARKAASINHGQPLASWLHHVTRCQALNAVRAEARLKKRELATSLPPSTDNPPTEPDWPALAPWIDDLVDRLPQTDRDLVLLRFYQNEPHAAIAARLGLSESIVRKRTSRAIGKLRALLGRRGITTSVTALSTLLPAHAITRAPVSLKASIPGATKGVAILTPAILSPLLIAVTATQKSILAGSLLLLVGIVGFTLLPERSAGAPSKSAEAPATEAQAARGSSPAKPPAGHDSIQPADPASASAEKTKSRIRPQLPEIAAPTTEETNALLKETIIPEVEFADITIHEVVEQLNQLDVGKTGSRSPLRFSADTGSSGKSIAELRLRSIPLSVVMNYVCEATASRYKVTGGNVTFTPVSGDERTGKE